MRSTLSRQDCGLSLTGDQRPRICSVPRSFWSEGARVRKLAASAGLFLDDWQEFVLDQGLGRLDDRSWAAFEVGLIVPRQNGKGSILEVLELAALFLDDFIPRKGLILHSAHEFKTAAEAFLRIRALITDNPVFERRVERIRTAAGQEAIELRNGKRLRFIARSKGSGRGFTSDLVILDEAYELGSDQMAALLPTLSTRPNPQVWYTSTAGMATSTQLARVRERGLAGGDPSLAFFEWSAVEDPEQPGLAAGMDDRGVWAQANPGLGLRISPEYVAKERAALDDPAFARERLGVGVYPTDLADAWQVISKPAWLACLDAQSLPEDPVAIAADAMPRGQRSAVGIAGRRQDGLMHVEVVDHRDDTAWVVPRITELVSKYQPCAVVVDKTGGLGHVIADLEDAGIEVTQPTSQNAAQACGQFFEDVADSGLLRHRGDPALMKALGGAASRPLSDAWAWDRRSPVVDICPLVAVTLAAWGHKLKAPSDHVGVWFV
jgi:phage terminase large subunit-like protein